MRSGSKAQFRISILGICALVLCACGESDPRKAVLQERTRWKVELVNWTESHDGGFLVTTRIGGPVRSELKKLTVRFEMIDSQGQMIHDFWKTFDLASFQRGVSQELTIRLESFEGVDGLRIDRVDQPTPEQEKHFEELQF